MSTTTLQLGAVLHDPEFDRRSPVSVAQLLSCILVCGSAYGAVMGTFGGFSGDHPLQSLYSAIKVPILILLSFGLCLPFFFMINTLLGLRDAFAEALAALLKAQAVVTLALAALAPYTAVWYCSTSKY